MLGGSKSEADIIADGLKFGRRGRQGIDVIGDLDEKRSVLCEEIPDGACGVGWFAAWNRGVKAAVGLLRDGLLGADATGSGEEVGDELRKGRRTVERATPAMGLQFAQLSTGGNATVIEVEKLNKHVKTCLKAPLLVGVARKGSVNVID